ncbi:MAG: DUF211 domain-containing protein [Candidatus Methanofastidiosia archaeon]
MPNLKLLVLDVLKPHKPILPEFAEKISMLNNVIGVNVSLIEVDQKTENVKVSIIGENLNYSEIEKTIEYLGGTIHSIDKVAAGKKIIEEVDTGQDR